MSENTLSFDKPTNEIYSSGKVVGITDQIYNIKGSEITFKDVLVKGEMSGELEYNGVKIKVIKVNTMIGLEMSSAGPRGPVWKGVECEVIK